MAEFAYTHRGQATFRGRWLRDVPLPGDEDEVVGALIERAWRRDSHMNWDELDVYICTRAQLLRRTRWCTTPLCEWCGNHLDSWP